MSYGYEAIPGGIKGVAVVNDVLPHLTGATDDEDRPKEEKSEAFPITKPSCRRGRTNFDDYGRSGNE